LKLTQRPIEKNEIAGFAGLLSSYVFGDRLEARLALPRKPHVGFDPACLAKGGKYTPCRAPPILPLSRLWLRYKINHVNFHLAKNPSA
jgi:hypothetical protein